MFTEVTEKIQKIQKQLDMQSCDCYSHAIMPIRKISDEVSLTKKIETITAMDFRKSPGEVLTQVGLGKTFIITKNGKPSAVISRLPGQTLTMKVGRKGEVSYDL